MISRQETLIVQGWEVAMRTAEGCEFLSGFVVLSHCCREEASTMKPNRNCKDRQPISPTQSSLPRRPLRFARLRTITQCPVRMKVFSFLPSVLSCHPSPLSSSPRLFFCSLLSFDFFMTRFHCPTGWPGTHLLQHPHAGMLILENVRKR